MPHLSRVSSLALEPQGHGASLPNMDYFNAAEAMFDPVGRGSRAGLATPHDGLAWVQRVVGLPATLAARLFMSPPSAQLFVLACVAQCVWVPRWVTVVWLWRPCDCDCLAGMANGWRRRRGLLSGWLWGRGHHILPFWITQSMH